MGVACSTYGREERPVQCFGGEKREKETTWEDPGINGKIILRWIFRNWDGGNTLD
jgi:hypothetical protein